MTPRQQNPQPTFTKYGEVKRSETGQILPGSPGPGSGALAWPDDVCESAMQLFLTEFKRLKSVTGAADVVEERYGVPYWTLYGWRKSYPAFKAAWQGIKAYFDQAIEDALRQEALTPTGKDPTAKIMWLNAHRSKRYRPKKENKIESGPITFNLILSAPPEPRQLPAQSGKEITLDADN